MNNLLSEKLLEQFNYSRNLIHRRRQQQDFRANEINLDRGQGYLLGVLLAHDGLTQSELSAELNIRPASLGELVSKLEQNGYVKRRVNENDKRVSNVYLMEEGRKIVNEIIIKARQEEVGFMFNGLSEDEQYQLLTLMVKLNFSMKKNMPDFEG